LVEVSQIRGEILHILWVEDTDRKGDRSCCRLSLSVSARRKAGKAELEAGCREGLISLGYMLIDY